jgi:hypothetical protein
LQNLCLWHFSWKYFERACQDRPFLPPGLSKLKVVMLSTQSYGALTLLKLFYVTFAYDSLHKEKSV